MKLEEKEEKLAAMQKYFTISFFISFLLLLLSSLACTYMHDLQLTIVNKYFPLESAQDYNEIIIFLLGLWKILIIQFTLIPALAIWCIRKCCKCDCKNK